MQDNIKLAISNETVEKKENGKSNALEKLKALKKKNTGSFISKNEGEESIKNNEK